VLITPEARDVRAPFERLPRPRVAPAEPAPPRGDRVRPGTRALLVVFVVFTLLAVNELLVLGGHTERWFAWRIQGRGNSAFLGAAYAAGTVLSVLALRRRRWIEVRVPVVTVTAFTVLTLVPTLAHRHVLNLMAPAPVARLAAWVWLAVYVVVPVAGTLGVVRQERAVPRPEVVRQPMPAALVAVLLVQAAALAGAGAVLYVGGWGKHMPIAEMRPGWPWPITPLTSQVVGAWLLAFGFALVLAVRERDLSRMLVPAVAYAVFGAVEVAVLLLSRSAPGTDPLWLWADVTLFATLVPVGVHGARAASPERGGPDRAAT
jgi:hypothetical protein